MMTDLVARLRAPSVTNRPPKPSEIRRNDLAVLVTVVVALLFGLTVREQARSLHRTWRLGSGLPAVWYPAGWITAQPDPAQWQATNPASPSSYDAAIAVLVREQKPDETLDLARANWGLRRSETLNSYRELDSQPATVLSGQPAILIHYAYVADPLRTGGSAALPVVVEAEDLIFFVDGKVVTVTVAADSNEWEQEQPHFALVYEGLALQRNAAEAGEVISTPVATDTATPAEGSQQ